MEYSKIVSVSGLPGLFEVINSKSNGAIVRSLEDKSVKFVSSRIHQLTQLESIEIYTTGENMNLSEVLISMDQSKEKLPDEKDPDALVKYFRKIVPAIDLGKVHNSDMKKMVRWLGILKNNNIEIKLSEPTQEEPVKEPEAVPEKIKEDPLPEKGSKKAGVKSGKKSTSKKKS